jgi:hypothetical protein
MLEKRNFQIVLVGKDKGNGIELTEKPNKFIQYYGEEQIAQF